MTQAGKWMRLAAYCAMSSMAVMASPVAVSAKGYAELDALPDFSGVWQPDWQSLFAGRAAAAPKYTPETAKAVAEFNAKKAKGENLQTEDANCVPPGVPRIMRMPYPIEFLYTPQRITILTEAYMQARRIYTDGRPIPDDPDATFNGSSVGHWEGDTLVVDTVGFNPNTTIMDGVHPTEKTHMVERIRLSKPDMLTIEATMIDPALFTEPFTSKQDYKREKGWVIREYVCEENNRDAADPFGRPSMNIEE